MDAREKSEADLRAAEKDAREAAHRLVSFVTMANAGGVIASLSFLGTLLGKPVRIPDGLFLGLQLFLVGLLCAVIAQFYVFIWSHNIVRRLRIKLGLEKPTKESRPASKKTDENIAFAFAFLAMVIFLGGLLPALGALNAIAGK